MPFNEQWNTDDVLYRSIIVGLLNLLNRKVVYNQVDDAETVKQVSVPFFYYMYQNERFFQDFFQLLGDNCDVPKFAEGNYDPVPRGVINLTSLSINSAALTTKFVRGTFNREEEGTVKAYSAFLNPIPLRLTFDVDVLCATYLESMKIIQAVVDTFYKVAIFAVDYKGLRVPCQVGFSEDYNVERPITFSFGDDKNITMKFTLEMESYQPVFDKPSERFRGNVMDKGIGNTINTVSGVSGVSSYVTLEDPTVFKVSGYSGFTGHDHDRHRASSGYGGVDLKAPYGYDENGVPIQRKPFNEDGIPGGNTIPPQDI